MNGHRHRPAVCATSQQDLSEGLRPKRDRRVPVSSVPCPDCKAGVGELCRSASGKITQHVSRRRMALRAEQ